MKKFFAVIVCLFLFTSLPCFAEDLPAPFQKMKELACSCKVDKDGDFVWSKKVVIKGEEIIYSVLFLVSTDSTWVARSEGPYTLIVAWDGKEKRFDLVGLQFGRIVGIKELKETEAIDHAYKIVREMVGHKLF